MVFLKLTFRQTDWVSTLLRVEDWSSICFKIIIVFPLHTSIFIRRWWFYIILRECRQFVEWSVFLENAIQLTLLNLHDLCLLMIRHLGDQSSSDGDGFLVLSIPLVRMVYFRDILFPIVNCHKRLWHVLDMKYSAQGWLWFPRWSPVNLFPQSQE